MEIPSQSDQGNRVLIELRAWPAVKNTLVRYYDDLWRLIAANLLWFTISIPIVTLPAATIGLCRYCERLLVYDDPSLATILTSGFKRFLLRAYVFALVFLLTVVATGFSVFFYVKQAEQFGFIMLALGSLAICFTLFFLMCSIYVLPFMVHQDIGLGLAIKRSALLAGAKPLVTFLLLLLDGLLVGIVVQFRALPLILFVPSLSLLKNTTALLLALGELEIGTEPKPKD